MNEPLQELITRMKDLLLAPYHSNKYFKTEEIWRQSISNKLKELKKIK